MTDLFDIYPVARGKTDTSEAAAEVTELGVGNLRSLVYNAIKHSGTLGATTSEVSDIVERGYSGVQPRTSELRSMGYIEDSGQRRKHPDRRCQEIIWVITGKGE